MKTMVTRTVVGEFSPWGAVQSVRALAHDMESVTTASHGGLWLGPVRWAELENEFHGFKSYAGAPWLEEDCDVTLAILLWPLLFPPETVWEVVRACLNHPKGDGEWARALAAGRDWLQTGTDRAQSVRRLVERWERANGDTWLQGGGMTNGEFWNSEWRRVGSADRRVIKTREIPRDRAMSTAELDALAAV